MAVLLFFICWIVLATVLVLMRSRWEKVYNAAVFVLFSIQIICYIQGNFLVSRLPSLEGANVDWGHFGFGKATSIALVIGVAGVMLLLWKILKSMITLWLIDFDL